MRLKIGVMTEVVQESLDFMWDVLCDERGPITNGTKLEVEYVQPRSACMECGYEFDHDRLHVRCPKCGSASTLLLKGRELDVVNFDIDTPDDPADSAAGDEAPTEAPAAPAPGGDSAHAPAPSAS